MCQHNAGQTCFYPVYQLITLADVQDTTTRTLVLESQAIAYIHWKAIFKLAPVGKSSYIRANSA